MKLCVGAVTRRVIEVAAELHVPQIVASRRQVDIGGGYTGLDQEQLVHLVHDITGGITDVVRDHGGPYQNGDPHDDWIRSFDADVAAGFNSLHIDVCKIAESDQSAALHDLLERYAPKTPCEIGGERDAQTHLESLLHVALKSTIPTFAVVDLGGHIWNDRQCGILSSTDYVARLTESYNRRGVGTKAHNADWLGMRHRYDDVLDAMNIAPEFAGVETDAWLQAMSMGDGHLLLEHAYTSRTWERWFAPGEGSPFDRARCAVRYVLEDKYSRNLMRPYVEDGVSETFVRGRIQDALIHW